MAEGLKGVTYKKDGLIYHLCFEIPHIVKGENKDGLAVSLTADENTPTWSWMAKLRAACSAVVELIETNGLDKNG